MPPSYSDGLSDDLVWKYDVFISFGGKDTRGFVNHLVRAFDQKSISTFLDTKLKSGEDILEEFRKAIQQSRLSIVVFSEDYASSKWCLKELVQIAKCVRLHYQILTVPVFYGVDPYDVLTASGSFRQAFEKYDGQMEEDVLELKSALQSATRVFGWDTKDYREDAQLIEEVVQHVFNKLIGFSSSVTHWKYDVFLNFRGDDTRKSFVSHLYKALSEKAINTFMDDEELGKGSSLSELLKSIKRSRVSIVVFSENYCSSTWCLRELVQILKCMDEKRQTVVPVFYQVDPSAVCKPEAFPKVEMEEVESWTSALTSATKLTLPGWDSPVPGWDSRVPRWDSRNYGDDAKLIEDIVQQISGGLHHLPYFRMEWLLEDGFC